eukprot:TRINITY_DN28999_c0_g1_i1.p1 TRINITY_DN28999_c0_g1~~TRINITY_DN28999_c0_g1_i1.p1  ORF type:complete len:458 (-),score=107.80 TRINITY_DN28999_c0_g1_i1:106-1437(-)
MGKKAGQSAKAPPAAASSATASATTQSWLDGLTEEDQKLARAVGCSCQADLDREKAQKSERERKAKDAQRTQLWHNEKQRQWEKEEEKKQREKARQDKQWEQKAEAAKQRGLKEGSILEAWEYPDGSCWVQLPGDLWKETQGQYYCKLCEKHLNDSSLEGHLDSKAHVSKVAWEAHQTGAGGTGYAAASSSSATPWPASPAAPAKAPPTKAAGPVAGAWQAGTKEDWQELGADGMLRCIPCGKVFDDIHAATDAHQDRVRRWREQQELERSGYAPPDLPYLAWVPWDASQPNGERQLKCLLCKKWCQDDSSHTGTKQNPAGSKEHRKYLAYGPGDPWYETNVVQERLKYHPARASPSISSVARQPAPARAAPWASAAPPTAPSAAPCAKPAAAAPPWSPSPPDQPPPPAAPPPKAAGARWGKQSVDAERQSVDPEPVSTIDEV